MKPHFQSSFTGALLLTCVILTTGDFMGLSQPIDALERKTQPMNKELYLGLLARLRGVTGEIVEHEKFMSGNETMQLRTHMLEILQTLDTHHPGSKETSNLRLQPAPPVAPTPSPSKHPPNPPPQPSECGVIPDPYPGSSNIPLGHRKRVAAKQKVPLAYFEAGYHGNVSSGDPRVFGPDAWRTLHRFSIHYPETPTSEAMKACESFMQGLPYMIPCPHCGYHLQEFVVMNEQSAGEFREACLGNCTSIKQMCATQANLVSFFARAHNNVNIHNYKFRPNFTTADVYKTYAHGSVHMSPYGPGPTPWTTQGPIDGKCQLISSTVGQNVTGTPDFWKSGEANEVLTNLETCSFGSEILI